MLGDFYFYFFPFLVNVDVLRLRFFRPGLGEPLGRFYEMINVAGSQAVNPHACFCQQEVLGSRVAPGRCQNLGAATADHRRGSSL